MKITHVICTFPPYKGGMGNGTFEFCRELVLSGREITVLTPNYRNELEVEMVEGISVCRLFPWLKYGNAAFIPGLLRQLKNFDIVHLHYPFFGGTELVWLAKKILRMKFKLIIQYHMDVNLSSPWQKLLRLPDILTRRSLFRLANAVICSSLDYAQNSDLQGVYPMKKIKEIPFGVDVERFQPATDKTNDEKINFLFVGGLDQAHYFKGVDVLLEAAALLKRKNWLLRIVGKGELKVRFEQRARELGIEKQVVFMDNVSYDDLPAVYRQSDIFVLPSINRNEAFGVVLLEAMASGLAVVASNLPGVRSVFSDGVHGFLIAPKNVGDLRNKLNEFLLNKELAARMGRQGRMLVLEKYNWKEVSARLNQLYN